jgi:hypothetical protein
VAEAETKQKCLVMRADADAYAKSEMIMAEAESKVILIEADARL